MYDLRVVVEDIKGFCDLPMRQGDHFFVRGGKIEIPAGKYMCIWALQSLLPMLPVKQRNLNEPNDWIEHTHRMVCPDPNGMVVFRIERLDTTGRVVHSADVPKRLLVDASVCSGCRSCELACSLAHTSAFDPENSRIWIDKDEPSGLDTPHACRQCGNAACVNACPTGALGRDDATGALLLYQPKCTGCAACVNACVFNALRMNREHTYPLTCDLCQGEPHCVRACVTGAIRYARAAEGER